MMRGIRSMTVAGLLVALAAAGVAVSARAAGPAPKPRTLPARPGIACPATGCVTYDWNVVPSPSGGTVDNELIGIAVISPLDAWAVGRQVNVVNNKSVTSTLIEHWNGQAWSIVSSPNLGSTIDDYLTSVAVVSANDIWAVGPAYPTVAQCPNRDLVEHWDGNAWTLISAPALNEDCSDELFGVAAVATDDVWAVGKGYDPVNKGDAPITEHWDGQTWTIVPCINPIVGGFQSFSYFEGVTATSSSDVWAVGHYVTNVGYYTLAEHWNGVQWSFVPSPSPSSARNELLAVNARAANDIWAVGDVWDSVTLFEDPLIEHWDGTSWTAVPRQNFCSQTDCGVLKSVVTLAANNVWAVGSITMGTGVPLIVHWDGGKWSVSSTPPRSARYLNGVSGSATSAPIAVGTWGGQASILRYGPPQFPMKGPTRR